MNTFCSIHFKNVWFLFINSIFSMRNVFLNFSYSPIFGTPGGKYALVLFSYSGCTNLKFLVDTAEGTFTKSEEELTVFINDLYEQFFHYTGSSQYAVSSSLDTVTSLDKSLMVNAFSFATVLFIIGVFGFLFNRSNVILMLIAIELMFLGSSLLFLFLSNWLDDPRGHIYALVVLTVAAAESAIGLALVTVLYRLKNDVSLTSFATLRG